MLFDKIIDREYLDHKVLGDLALKLGKYDKALNHYKKQEYYYFNQDDEKVIALDEIGGTYFIEEIYEKIIEIYLQQKDYQNAINYCQKQIELDEYKEVNKGRAVIALADVYNLSGQKNKAVDILEDLLNYELEKINLEPDDYYPKKLYIDTCYKLIDILKDVDKKQSQKYTDLAMDMYRKNKQVDLGSQMAGVLELQSKFYKKDLQEKISTNQNLSEDDLKVIEQICRNCVLASEIYLDEYEDKARASVLEGIEMYEKFNLDNFKLHFDLRYQLAYVDSKTYSNYISDENTYNDYLKAYEILKENNFFDKYKKNLILDELARYCDFEDFELKEKYRNECDYYYIAQYNVEHSKKWIVSFISEYEKAGDNYKSCDKYDMAIKCYKKALYNLSRCGLFTDEFYEEEMYLGMWDKIYVSYNKYIGLCEEISYVYEYNKNEYDEAIKYLNMKIDCINKYRDSSELSLDKYRGFFYTYEKIANILNKKADFENSIKYYMFLIGVVNSPNLDNKICDKYDDIEHLLNLFEEDKINEYILSEEFNINLNNKYMNRMKYLLEDLLKVVERTENQQIIDFCNEKLYLIKDTPFDI